MDIFIKNGVIKQREEVEQTIFKKHYDTDYKGNLPGPYYDPCNNHCHVWKPLSLIKNFKGEQSQSEMKYRKHTEELPTRGVYCAICHLRLKSKGYDLKKVLEIPTEPYFKKRKAEEDLSKLLEHIKITKISPNVLWDRFYILLLRSYINKYKRLYTAIVDVKTQKNKIINKWHCLSKKLIEPYVFYPINGLESIRMKVSEVTPFQRFKYNNPNYRKTSSFIIRSDKFDKDYVTIS